MGRRKNYYTLIASLPALPPRFDVDRVPITWPRLQERLQMLEPQDADTLQRLLDFLAWDRQPFDTTDDDVISHYKKLMTAVRHPLIKSIIDQRVTTRTIISALRRRRLGLGPPPGIGEWADVIRRRWNLPQFGLEARFPWIAELDRYLATGAATDAERLILSISWTAWSREANNYHFTFEAVLLYVARWATINRWTSLNAPAGLARFNTTLSTLLENHVYAN